MLLYFRSYIDLLNSKVLLDIYYYVYVFLILFTFSLLGFFVFDLYLGIILYLFYLGYSFRYGLFRGLYCVLDNSVLSGSYNIYGYLNLLYSSVFYFTLSYYSSSSIVLLFIIGFYLITITYIDYFIYYINVLYRDFITMVKLYYTYVLSTPVYKLYINYSYMPIDLLMRLF
jgi:hypothetical protein